MYDIATTWQPAHRMLTLACSPQVETWRICDTTNVLEVTGLIEKRLET